MAVDFKSLGKNDQGALIAGGLAVILTFFPAYAKASVEAKGAAASVAGSMGGSESRSAWIEWATLGALLIVVAFVLVAIRVFAKQVLPAGLPWNLVTAALAGLGTLLLVLYVFTFGAGDVPDSIKDSIDISTGPGWSGWILIIAAIAFTVFAALGFKDSGEKIPEFGTDTPAA